MPAADIAAMFIGLVRFTGAVYPDRLDAVDDVLAACQQERALPLDPDAGLFARRRLESSGLTVLAAA